MQIWAESGKSALPICNYSQILYQFLTFTQNLKRSRFSCVPMDYVLKCKKAELREQVNNFLNHTAKYDDILNRGRLTFSNQGHVCKDILDAIEYYTQNGTTDNFLAKKLKSNYRFIDMWN